MIEFARLGYWQILALRLLSKRGGGIPILMARKFQRALLSLWRRDLVQVWYRQTPTNLEGPYYSLTIVGGRLAGYFASNNTERQS